MNFWYNLATEARPELPQFRMGGTCTHWCIFSFGLNYLDHRVKLEYVFMAINGLQISYFKIWKFQDI